MREEMAMVPWVVASDANAQPDAQKSGFPSPPVSLNDILAQVIVEVDIDGQPGHGHPGG
jgi:hypothetical protein